MKNNYSLSGLYPITPTVFQSDLEYIDNIKEVIKSGIKIFQFRTKYMSFKRKKYLVHKIRNICEKFSVKLIINDDYQILKYFEGCGLHIGEADINLKRVRKIYGEDIIIGKSCYDSLNLARWSEKNGASYVSFGSMYETKSKNNTIICDHQLLSKAKKSLNIPICVIGGITKHNIKNILYFKPDMISMISGIFDSKRIKEEVSQIHAIIKNHEEIKKNI